jgi:dTDP-4-dehydrorhamnose 3,5-epimerase
LKFRESKIPGVFLIEAEPHTEERGFFARLYCPNEFATVGIAFTPVQVNLSRNVHRHTLRGMHYQAPPYAEAKLVHVTHGTVHDVVVDLRQGSPAYGRWAAFELDAASLQALYIPEGCAHGFLTLEPETDVLYHMGRIYVPGRAKGYRWNDPQLKIDWPAEPEIVSFNDTNWPDFSLKSE